MVLLALGALVTPCAASAWCRSRSASGQPDPAVCPSRGAFLGWRERCAGYALDTRTLPAEVTAADFREAAELSAAAWASASCDPSTGAQPSFVWSALPEGPSTVGYFVGQRNVNTVAFRDHWGDDAAHRDGATAITLVTFDAQTGQLLDADIEFNLRTPDNPAGYLFSVAGDPLAADFQTVLTHELGHAQGLAHSADADAVMGFSAGRTFAQRALSSDDMAAICAVAPPQSPATCDPEAAGAPRPVAAPQGCSVSSGVRGPPVAVPTGLLLCALSLHRAARRRRASRRRR